MAHDPLKGVPKRGDIFGDPNAGHRVRKLWAAVIIYPSGDEGLVSSYAFDGDGRPTERLTFVTSDPVILPMLETMLSHVKPPEGGRIEWREFHA